MSRYRKGSVSHHKGLQVSLPLITRKLFQQFQQKSIWIDFIRRYVIFSTSWLPHSTDSYLHILVFVLVSWLGGGNPPWAEAKSLSFHCDQENQTRADFFSKLVLYVHEKGGITKMAMAKTGWKPTGCPKKMQHSDFPLRFVLEIQFNLSTCVSESKFWVRSIWTH